MAPSELKPVYFLAGTDRPKVERAVERLRGHFHGEAVERLFATDADGEAAVGACNAMGLFGEGGRLVLVEGVDRWKATDVKTIAEYLRSPAPDTVLALVGDEMKKDSPLAKACAKAGDVLVYDAASEESVELGSEGVRPGRRKGRARGVPCARRAGRRRSGRPVDRGGEARHLGGR